MMKGHNLFFFVRWCAAIQKCRELRDGCCASQQGVAEKIKETARQGMDAAKGAAAGPERNSQLFFVIIDPTIIILLPSPRRT